MAGFRTFITNRLTWITIVFVAVFTTMAWISQPTTLSESIRTLITTLGFIGMIPYVSIAVKAYNAHRWPNDELLAALACFLICAGAAFGGLFQGLWRLSDFQNYVVTNDFYSFTMALTAAGLFILISTPNLIGRGVPWTARAKLLILWSISAGVVIGTALYSPDLKPVAEWLKPYLESCLNC